MPDLLRRRSAVLVVAVLAAVAALALVFSHPQHRPVLDRTAAGALTPDAAAQRSDLVMQLLDRRASAVLNHDRAGFLATVDPQDPTFLAAQATLYDNLQGVPFESWAYAVDPGHVQSNDPARDRRYRTWWAPRVILSTELQGVDVVPATATLQPTFVLRGTQWFLAAEDTADRALWDDGPVVWVRGTTSLVLGHPGSEPELQRLAIEADAAVAAVTKAVGTGWSQRVVVVLPRDPAELADLARTGQSVTQLGAISVGGPGPGGDRVLVNAAAFAQLGPVARQIVLTHELTHVAMRPATTGHTPTWLSEGLADHVGYAGTGISLADAVTDLRTEVQAGRVPAALPANEAFGGDNPELPVAYGGARWAYELLVTRLGEPGALAAYRAVGRGEPLEEAFGMSTADFTAAWQASMRQQLG